MEVLGMTHSACAACRTLVPAKVLTDGRDVYFRKFCPVHGETEVFVRSDVADYLASLRYVKPAWTPREFAGNSRAACPDGCGFCDRHEQHLCLPIVEITSRCDLDCPVCIADAGRPWDMSLSEFSSLLDALIRAEGQMNVLNFSGGEPLIHPQVLAFVEEALSRPEIVRVNISTNGLRLLAEPAMLDFLAGRGACIALQFDGFDEKPYEILRGRPLLHEKLQILKLLEDAGVTTVLTMTAARGVNDDQFRAILDYFFSHEHVVNLTIQPAAFAGRGADLAARAGGTYRCRPQTVGRLTIPDVIKGLAGAGHPAVGTGDFIPLPCSHPLCVSVAFYLALNTGKFVSLSQIVQAGEMLDAISNRVFFGLAADEYEHLKRMIYELWSGPASLAPDSDAVMDTLRGILRQLSCGCFDPRKVFSIAERRVKSIFIHAFQDADTFDLARVRRCCNAYPQPDGRVMPSCAYNIFHRPGRCKTGDRV